MTVPFRQLEFSHKHAIKTQIARASRKTSTPPIKSSQFFFIHIQLIYFCHDLAMKWNSDYHHWRLLELGMNCCWICRWIFVKNLFMKISIILSNNSASAWESTFQYFSRLMGIYFSIWGSWKHCNDSRNHFKANSTWNWIDAVFSHIVKGCGQAFLRLIKCSKRHSLYN